MGEPRSILLLCDDSRQHAANVLQHIAALSRLSRHEVYPFNPVDRAQASAALDLDEFDVVVIHYTIMVTANRYLSSKLAAKIAAFRGLKVQLIQDEYRSVDAVTANMRELGIDVLYTCVPAPEREEIYGPRLPGVTLVTTLPGFVPDELMGRDVAALEQRPVDVGYRGRDVPYWLGRLGREKVEIGRGFLEHAARYGLRCDISSSEADRLYGERWNRFLQSCRATLGTESGASVVDFDGSIQQRIGDYLVRHSEASFEEVERRILGASDGAITIHVASPRLFEAAALRTALVLFRGDYSGLVEPWTHYLPLEKDFSNMDEVAHGLRDLPLLKKLTARASADLVESGRYSLRSFVSELDNLVEERSTTSAGRRKSHYHRARVRRTVPSWRRPSKLRATAGKVLVPILGLVLVGRDGSMRRLAAAGLRVGSIRADRLAQDLWRLTALRNGVDRGSFGVRTELDTNLGQLIISSRAERLPPGEPGLVREATQLLNSGGLKEIVWNHSRLGVSVGLGGGTLLAMPIGVHGVSGAHSFCALTMLAGVEPQLVLDALEPVLREHAEATRTAVELEA